MFKAGDKVLCVEGLGDRLTEGKIYEVAEDEYKGYNDDFIKVRDDNGIVHSYYSDRFVLAEERNADVIEMGKEYVCNGVAHRVLCVDAPGDLSVVTIDGVGNINRWFADGKNRYGGHSLERKLVRWLNVYKNGGIAWNTKEDADNSIAPDRIACIRVEFEEGQFDD